MKADEISIPRIALLISDADQLAELERLLRPQYSSLMVITKNEKLLDFPVPLIVVADTIKRVCELRKLSLVEGTQILVISREKDSEVAAAGFDVGADDILTYPFEAETLINKLEKYLEEFRTAKSGEKK